MTQPAEQIQELDVAAMVADMRPPTDDDIPIALDGTPLDTPAKVIAYLEEINARRGAAEPRPAAIPSASTPSASLRSSTPTGWST